MLTLIAALTLSGLVSQSNPQMIPAKNGTTCPGGTSYAGAGCCKVRAGCVPWSGVKPEACDLIGDQ